MFDVGQYTPANDTARRPYRNPLSTDWRAEFSNAVGQAMQKPRAIAQPSKDETDV